MWRCGNCKREHSAKFETVPPQPYSADGQFAPLIVVDCRGLEFTGFDPRVRYTLIFHLPRFLPLITYQQGTWKCVGVESGSPFELDLSEGEWVDYDEKVRVSQFDIYPSTKPRRLCIQAAQPVSVMEIEGRWSRAP